MGVETRLGAEKSAVELLDAAGRLAAEAAMSQEDVAQISARAADRPAAWHCPVEWRAAARLVSLPAFAEPDSYGQIAAQVTPGVADLVQRFHTLNRAIYPQPRGRPELARPAFQYLQKLFIASFTDEPVTFLALGHLLALLADLSSQRPAHTPAQVEHLRVACLPLLERFGMWEEQRLAAEELIRLSEPVRAVEIEGLDQAA